jgi:hypothetical protein
LLRGMPIEFVPQVRDLALYAGDGAALRITIAQPDGSPVALTGALTAQIRHHRSDSDPLAEFAVDLSDAADGIAVLSLTGVQTAALMNGEDPMQGAWDAQWVPDGGEPVTLLQGAIRCSLDVTR